MTTSEAETILPPRDGAAVEALDRLLQGRPRPRLVSGEGEATELPEEIYSALVDVVYAMRGGLAVTIAPVSQKLTTSRAAEILNISRPTLVKLLDEGEIPYERPRRHRMVRLDDVLAFRERLAREQRTTLDAMTQQAVADGLYETNAADYSAALRESRSNS